MSQLQTIRFHGQSLVILDHDGEPYVAMRPVCEGIGLNWQGQLERIKRHPVLGKGVRIIRTPSISGDQDYTYLPLSMLNGWLFGVDANRVKPEIRERLIEYQAECFQVLYKHWHGPTQVSKPNTPAITADYEIPKGVQHAINHRAHELTRPLYDQIRKELRRQAEHHKTRDPNAVDQLPVPDYALVSGQAMTAAHQLATMQHEWFQEMADVYDRLQKLFPRGHSAFGDGAFAAALMKAQAVQKR